MDDAQERWPRKFFVDPDRGPEIQTDLHQGLSAYPIWMQDFLRSLISAKAEDDGKT